MACSQEARNRASKERPFHPALGVPVLQADLALSSLMEYFQQDAPFVAFALWGRFRSTWRASGQR